MKRRLFIFLFAFLIVLLSLGTTWFEEDATDPVSGEQISVRNIGSYGSYIYQWDSKYDLIYWPFTNKNWIWFNPKSGYGSFAHNFSTLKPKEIITIRKWLQNNYDPAKPPATHTELLEWIGKIYEIREMSDDHWNYYYRLMAYMYREDPVKSIEYVNKALPLIEKKYETKLSEKGLLEVLYLLGEYNRRLGNIEQAKIFFEKVKTQTYKEEDGTETTGHPYFLELIENREQLMQKTIQTNTPEDENQTQTNDEPDKPEKEKRNKKGSK
ncbi:MAG: DUF2225 domain-containing protein [Leptospirales bacterium]